MGIGGYQAGFFFDLSGSYVIPYANAAAGAVNLVGVGFLFFPLPPKGCRSGTIPGSVMVCDLP